MPTSLYLAVGWCQGEQNVLHPGKEKIITFLYPLSWPNSTLNIELATFETDIATPK